MFRKVRKILSEELKESSYNRIYTAIIKGKDPWTS